MLDVAKGIDTIINSDTCAVWAAADLTYSDYKNDYLRAVIVAQQYNEFIFNENYDEAVYHQMLITLTETINQKILSLKQFFDKEGIRSYIPPVAQENEENLRAPFSFKYGAVQAGLGWIGKNGVLITKKFGPRVRLGAILVDYPLVCGTPIQKSLCGTCQMCVDACPWKLVKGTTWNSDSKREDILDFKKCNEIRSEFIKTNQRKHECGYCLLACPWGKQKERT